MELKNNVETNVETNIETEFKPVNNNYNIIAIKKEIANLKDTINQIFDSYESETFRTKDLINKIKIEKFNNDKNQIITIELQSIPIFNTLQVSYETGVYASTAYYTLNNLIIIRMGNTQNFLSKKKNFLTIKYITKNEKSIKHLEKITLKDTKLIYETKNNNVIKLKKADGTNIKPLLAQSEEIQKLIKRRRKKTK